MSVPSERAAARLSAVPEETSASDVRALAWVQDEVKRSLEASQKALQRHLRETEALHGSDVDRADPAILRAARTHLHQAAGALELVGLPVAARVVRAGEQAVQRMAERPTLLTPERIAGLEAGWVALSAYLERLTLGRPASGVSLFPHVRPLLEVVGAERIHPADLWDMDWRWRVITRDESAEKDQVPLTDAQARDAMERLVLRLMRAPDRATVRRMSDLCATLGAEAKGREATLWRLAAGFFEAQAQGLLRWDVYVKRTAPRLLALVRGGMKPGEATDRLALDMLFFCARALDPGDSLPVPRLRAVRRAYALEAVTLPDYEPQADGPRDPTAVAQARKRAVSAREAWATVASAEGLRLSAIRDSLALLQDSLQTLFAHGADLGQALQKAAATLAPAQHAAPEMALEVATALLAVEAALDDGDLVDAAAQATWGVRMLGLADRIDAVLGGAPMRAPESWMEEVYRRASEQQTMGTVVSELRGSLAEVERQLDLYARDPIQRNLLQPVPSLLSHVGGVVSVLGLAPATAACERMRADLDQLAHAAAIGPDAAQRDQRLLDRLADNLGALLFVVDILAVQPLLARLMFRFDDASGRLHTLMPRRPGETAPAESAIDALADPGRPGRPGPVGAAALPVLLEPDTRADAPAWPAAAAAPEAPTPTPAPTPSPVAPADDSEDMLAVFLEEAAEVIAEGRSALDALTQPGRDPVLDVTPMTALRRSFHTLKGSSRMVGLTAYGEAAWACEQLYNARLAQAPQMDEPLAGLTRQLLDYLADWAVAVARRESRGHRPEPVVRSADAMRQHRQWLVLALPAASSAPVSAPAPAPAPAPASVPVSVPVREPLPAAMAPAPAPIAAMASPAVAAALEAEAGQARPAEPDPLAPPAPASLPAAVPPPPEAVPEDAVKVIGPLRIDIAMFNIFLNEADEQSRRLAAVLGEWALASVPQAPPEEAADLAHSLAGSSATVGYAALSSLAKALEHALLRGREAMALLGDEAELFAECTADLRRMLHQFAAGFLVEAKAGLWQRLEDYQPAPRPAAVVGEPLTVQPVLRSDDDVDLEDSVDGELLSAFAEEAEQHLPQLQAQMRAWAAQPHDRAAPAACMRTLHTLKGAARLAGAMRVGELAHRLESTVEQYCAEPTITAADVESLLWRVDALESAYQAMREAAASAAVVAEPGAAAADEASGDTAQAAAAAATHPPAATAPDDWLPAQPLAHLGLDWAPLVAAEQAAALDERGLLETVQRKSSLAATFSAVRVRSTLLDRLVNHAGETSIARTRLEADLSQVKASLADLNDNLERLRRQLRDVELQAEVQIISRMEAAKAASVDFDPLEMDRYTRVQELTRMMAESVNDVATVQRSLQRALQSGEDQVAAQGRLLRSLQDDLMRTRMVEFESLSDRLYRIVRQTSREAGKQVTLDIVGGSIEIDRGVLERMTAPFEHLLRNAVAHGIESPERRQALGKPPAGVIRIQLAPEGNEVAIEFSDDGAGLDVVRIREQAAKGGFVAHPERLTDDELAELIFVPGFTTMTQVTELAGRGVGMDVVRAEVQALGGRIQTHSRAGEGTRFRMVLPLTTAVTQVLMVRCGERRVAIPSTLIEQTRREPAAAVEAAYRQGLWMLGAEGVPFHWLAALLGGEPAGAATGHQVPVIIVRSAAQRVAIHVDEVLGHAEVVVKNLGPQLARLPGLAGITLLASGQVATIYNPVALAARWGGHARRQVERLLAEHPPGSPLVVAHAAAVPAPLVLVVDDSLTVRRITQRLLLREGYRVHTAKDGQEALERIAEERPRVILSDIEMPRMDGFDLLRHLRADAATADLPVIMITSRIAQKHRDYARELGVRHYLGKPYGEDELLSVVARLARPEVNSA